jgi:hypothetical protein
VDKKVLHGNRTNMLLCLVLSLVSCCKKRFDVSLWSALLSQKEQFMMTIDVLAVGWMVISSLVSVFIANEKIVKRSSLCALQNETFISYQGEF